MRLKTIIFLITAMALAAAASADGLLDELGMPVPPDAKLVSEGNLTQGEVLNEIVDIYGPLLGLSDVQRVANVVYAIESKADAGKIIKSCQPGLAEKGWKPFSSNFEHGGVTAILYNEAKGIIYMDVNAPGSDRRFTVMRVYGKVDPAKAANPGERWPQQARLMTKQAAPGAEIAAKIPLGQAIAIPPSERLHVKSTRSTVRARVADRNTAELRLLAKLDPGELVRVDDRLMLALTPGIDVEEIILPSNFPLLLELTDGWLLLNGGPNSNDRPSRLNVISTGAAVAVESLPLVSGQHAIKSLGGEVRVALSEVAGGSLDIEVTGKNIMVAFPRNASASLDVMAQSGRIENLTGLEMSGRPDNHFAIKMGAGKAEISLRAINGTVCIKYAD